MIGSEDFLHRQHTAPHLGSPCCAGNGNASVSRFPPLDGAFTTPTPPLLLRIRRGFAAGLLISTVACPYCHSDCSCCWFELLFGSLFFSHLLFLPYNKFESMVLTPNVISERRILMFFCTISLLRVSYCPNPLH